MNKKMRSVRCLVYLYVQVFFLMNMAIANDISPEDIVKKYYVADLNGARLAGKTYKEQISPLITWKNEPGWDFSFITKKAYISKIEKGDNKATIEVRYDNVGFLNGDQLIEQHFTEVIIFSLIKTGKQWKIMGPIFPPHVLPSVLAGQLEQILLNEKDKKRIERFSIITRLIRNM